MCYVTCYRAHALKNWTGIFFITSYITLKWLHNIVCNICYQGPDCVLYSMLFNMLNRYKLNVHPRGYNPTLPAGGPRPRAGESAAYVRRRRHSLTHLQGVLNRLTPGPVAGRDALWAGHVPPAGRAGTPCCDWPAGPAGPRPDQARTDLRARGRKKEKSKVPVKPAAPDRAWGILHWRSRGRAENRRGRRRWRFQESSMAHLLTVRSGCSNPSRRDRRDVDTCRAGRRHGGAGGMKV